MLFMISVRQCAHLDTFKSIGATLFTNVIGPRGWNAQFLLLQLSVLLGSCWEYTSMSGFPIQLHKLQTGGRVETAGHTEGKHL